MQSVALAIASCSRSRLLKVDAPFWPEALLYIRRAIDPARVGPAVHQFVRAAALAAGDRLARTICFGSQNPPSPLIEVRHCSTDTKPQLVPPPPSTAHHQPRVIDRSTALMPAAGSPLWATTDVFFHLTSSICSENGESSACSWHLNCPRSWVKRIRGGVSRDVRHLPSDCPRSGQDGDRRILY